MTPTHLAASHPRFTGEPEGFETDGVICGSCGGLVEAGMPTNICNTCSKEIIAEQRADEWNDLERCE